MKPVNFLLSPLNWLMNLIPNYYRDLDTPAVMNVISRTIANKTSLFNSKIINKEPYISFERGAMKLHIKNKYGFSNIAITNNINNTFRRDFNSSQTYNAFTELNVNSHDSTCFYPLNMESAISTVPAAGYDVEIEIDYPIGMNISKKMETDIYNFFKERTTKTISITYTAI